MPDVLPVLQVEDAEKAYGGATVLTGVSFTVDAGAAVALVGANGSGKSTLLRCLIGSEAPDAGRIAVDGAELDESDPAVRAAVAALLDDADWFPDLSVTEHLRLVAWLHGTPDAEDAVTGAVEEVGLAGAADQLPPTLSAGQRHRLGLASCLVRPWRLLLLDEPEQHLDVAGRAWLARRLVAEKDRGGAVVLASHDAGLVSAVADRTVELGG